MKKEIPPEKKKSKKQVSRKVTLTPKVRFGKMVKTPKKSSQKKTVEMSAEEYERWGNWKKFADIFSVIYSPLVGDLLALRSMAYGALVYQTNFDYLNGKHLIVSEDCRLMTKGPGVRFEFTKSQAAVL